MRRRNHASTKGRSTPISKPVTSHASSWQARWCPLLVLLLGGIAILIVGCSVLCWIFLIDIEDGSIVVSTPELAAKFQGQTIEAETVHSAYDLQSNRYNFGRYATPLLETQLHDLNVVQTVAQRKEFVWVSLTGGDWLVGMAMLQFNYVASVVINAFNKATLRSYQRKIELPGPFSMWGPQWTPDDLGHTGLIAGCVVQETVLGVEASFCYEPKTNSVEVKIKSTVFSAEGLGTPLNVRFSFSLQGLAFPTMVFPLGPKRAAIVSKIAAAPAAEDAILSLGDMAFVLSSPVVALDYTRGLLRRLTVWKWMSLSTTSQAAHGIDTDLIRSYGMHLSRGTYDFIENVSAESTIFVNGQDFSFLDSPNVTFTKLTPDVDPDQSQWTVTDGRHLNLTFSPKGRFDGRFNYLVVDGALWHMWGLFTGTAPLPARYSEAYVEIKNVAGVLEDHYALW